MDRFVGLLVTTMLNGKRVAILQRRGLVDVETLTCNSYAGMCELTVLDVVDERREPIHSLRGRVAESLGEHFTSWMYEHGEIVPLMESKEPTRDLSVFTVHLPDPRLVLLIHLHSKTGGLHVVDAYTPIHSVESYPDAATKGIQHLDVTVMRFDEGAAVMKLLHG